jgi:hypothetical protein
METIGKSVGEMKSTMRFRVARKYQIKEIFCEDNVTGETTKYSAKIWTALDKLRGDILCKTTKWKLRAQKEMVIEKLKKVVRKEDFEAVMKTLEDRNESSPDWYLEKYKTMDNWLANTFNDYRTRMDRG